VLADCDLFLPGLDEIRALTGLGDADAARLANVAAALSTRRFGAVDGLPRWADLAAAGLATRATPAP
jgi:sugar/nucleoside kinase (ribokinase family)